LTFFIYKLFQITKLRFTGMPECKFGINDKIVMRGFIATTSVAMPWTPFGSTSSTPASKCARQ